MSGRGAQGTRRKNKVLSAEDMALKTHGKVEDFPVQPRDSNCPVDVVIESAQHLEELRRQYPLSTTTGTGSASTGSGPSVPPPNVTATPRGVVPLETVTDGGAGRSAPASTSSQKKRKVSGSKTPGKPVKAPPSNDHTRDPTVNSAIREIGGLLTSLTLEQRNAVLKKVNGAFGFNPKPMGKSGGGGSKAKVATQKSDVNAQFVRTFEGQLLEETSREMKRISRSKNDKPSSELHALHRELLSTRARVRNGEITLPDFSFTEDNTPKSAVDDLLTGYRHVKSHCDKAGVTLAASEIFRGSQCLLRGQRPEEGHVLAGLNPDKSTWTKATRKVPRTEQEAERRAVQILASRKQRKERKKSSDNQSPIPKRVRLDTSAPKDTAPAEDPQAQVQNVGMETEVLVRDKADVPEEEGARTEMSASDHPTMGDTEKQPSTPRS